MEMAGEAKSPLLNIAHFWTHEGHYINYSYSHHHHHHREQHYLHHCLQFSSQCVS
uniref:Uncharacterized protein n=1 Tax=Anguilla anguilla TaxID=7936 RepID=A0A0E9PD60_ANGAN